MTTPHHSTDYFETMQAAALGFLRRHEGQYLGESQALFQRAVENLQTLGVQRTAAERLVARAHDQLEALKGHRFLDIDASTGDTAVLVNPATGLRYRIPVQEIFDALIDEDPGAHSATR